MNKTRYRIVFNKARGCLMAVAETAIAQGKGASGATTCGATHPGQLRLSVLGLVCKWLAGTALVCLPLAWLAPSQAQTVATRIVADPTAPSAQRPTVLTTSNGVVQVDIRTPSAAGVSRNTYSQFDVGAAGAVLNNSRTPVQTQQGGWVQGNPWLATGSARVILNEVNSSNPSYLQGYVEVAGQRAQVIIANPSGIAINGGGFYDPNGTGIGRLPYGFILHQGKYLLGQQVDDKEKVDFVGMTKNGNLIAGNYNKKELRDLGAVEGLTFGPPLIIKGQKVIKSGDGGWGISPRSAIGQKKDGTMLFLVIDGRQPGYSIGATLVDSQNILYENGAYIAANLDGGSSTTLYYNGKVVNKPADLLGERMIPTAFIVK